MLERLWAGWRGEYVENASFSEGRDECVFCSLLSSGESDDKTYLVWRGEHTHVRLNAFPYTTGHVLVMPNRHVVQPHQLSDDEGLALWQTLSTAVEALRAAYQPNGINVGANLGETAGASIEHLHLHALPRWAGDTNFMTSVAETRVLPEALDRTWEKLRGAWPGQTQKNNAALPSA